MNVVRTLCVWKNGRWRMWAWWALWKDSACIGPVPRGPS